MTNRFPQAYPLRNHFLVLLILIAAGGLIYAHSLQAPFIYDDINNILLNPHIRMTELSWSSLTQVLESRETNRPFANLTLALNYYCHHYETAGYHMVNLAIHLITAFLVYLLARQTLALCRREEAWPPFMAALLWLVNPVHTQSVTYIVQRMNSLAAMFYLLTLVCYIQARRLRSRPGSGLLAPGMLLAAALLAALLAVTSKEIAATLPLLLFLYEWYFFQALDRAWLKRKIKWLAGIAAVLAAIALIYMNGDPLQRILRGYDYRQFTLAQRLLTEPGVIVYYLSLLVFPHPSRLILDYDYPVSTGLTSPLATLLAMSTLIVLLGAAFYAAKKNRLTSFAILWFLLTLVIESSIISLALVYEHRTYLPSIFVCIALTSGLCRFFRSPALPAGLLAGMIVVCSFWTWQRNGIWTERITFWQDNVAKTPWNAEVRNNLGKALLDKAQLDQAGAQFQRALALQPHNQAARLNLGAILQQKGQTEAAVRLYRQILHARTTAIHNQARFNLAMILHNQGKTGQAIHHLQQVMQQDPGNDQAAYKLGLFYRKNGQRQKAREWFAKAVRLRPDDAKIHNSLAVVLREMGLPQKALQVLEEGLQKTGPDAHLSNTLGLVHLDLGRYATAARLFEQVTQKAQPDDPVLAAAWNNLGLTAEKQEQTGQALRYYSRALSISPDYEAARQNRIRLLLASDQPGRAIPLLRQQVAKEPDNPALATQLALALAANNQPDKAIRVLETVIDKNYEIAVSYYNLACLHARLGQTEIALDRFRTALAHGYDNWEQIRTDPDLAGIRQTRQYRQIRAQKEAAGW